VKSAGRIFSAYPIDPGAPAVGSINVVWVITQPDRSETTVLLPRSM
jgi:hypothetical protein